MSVSAKLVSQNKNAKYVHTVVIDKLILLIFHIFLVIFIYFYTFIFMKKMTVAFVSFYSTILLFKDLLCCHLK